MKKIFLTLSVAFAVLAVSAQGTAKTDSKAPAKTETKKTDSKAPAKTDAKKTDSKAPAKKTDSKPATK